MELRDRIAMVTGAANGIGRATALLMAQEGARLALADLQLDALAEVASACEAEGAEVIVMGLDQRESASVDAAVAQAWDHFGRVDVLANIAGIYPLAPLEATGDDLWANVLGVNLTGTFYCCRAMIPRMVAQGAGVVLNTSSGSAFKALGGSAAYAASKAGIVGLSRVLAAEAAPSVRVNVVSPGPIMVRTLSDAEAANAPTGEDLGVVLGRWGTPREVAEMFVFLASDRAEWVTGQVFHVNGGRFMS